MQVVSGAETIQITVIVFDEGDEILYRHGAGIAETLDFVAVMVYQELLVLAAFQRLRQ